MGGGQTQYMCYGKFDEKVFEYRYHGLGGVKVLMMNSYFADDFN